jgi:GNAT superfamily N-acetyltransferase
MNIVEVNKENVSEKGFFCYMSKRRTEGYQRKLKWLKDRFDEGMRIKMLDLKQGGRGFIEYIPGESAWRAVNAEGYMFIHCIWVAGQSRGKGYATLLLNECIKDAKTTGMKGVAIVTSEGNWLVGKKFLLKHGFEPVEEFSPFELLVKKFDNSASPSFSGDFTKRLEKYGKGLTIFRSDQCP